MQSVRLKRRYEYSLGEGEETQTMNYVGQLAGQVFVQVKELYRGLNPATLSGCIDVIVVRQPDGSLQCSPFHVRFGKMGVLRSREKVVDIEINGEPVSLHMKLGENGEAFFVKETENDQEVVPSYLATSPILSDGAALMGSQLGKGLARLSDSGTGPSIQNLGSLQSTSGGENGAVRKRRKRRRKSKVDSLKREDNGEDSEDEDMFPIDMSSDDDKEPDVSRGSLRDIYRDEGSSGNSSNVGPFKQSNVYACSDGDWTPLQSPGGSRPTTPKSDSELVTKPTDKSKQDNPQMLWAWGELPQAAKPSFLSAKSEAPLVAPVSIPVSDSTHFRGESLGGATAGQGADVETMGAAAPMMSELEEAGHGSGPRPLSKTDSPSKKKDKRSRHLGADGVYLDDITELEPEVAALYFPKSDGGGAVRGGSEGGARSTSLSPQSASSSGVDSGVDSYSDQIGDLPSIAISLCGGLTDNKEITKEQFQEKAISYQQFAENPSIIDDPNLVVKIGTKYYNWATAAPLMLAMQAFQKPLPKATVENIMKEKMPKKGGRWWFSWRGRNSSVKSESPSDQGLSGNGDQAGKMPSVNRRKDESSSSDEDHRSAKQSPSSAPSDPMLTPGACPTRRHCGLLLSNW
ncbi:hypothetical protein AGOR_G00087590 [Albula goreensis]|uniref:Phosphatidate phosphatase n=1 Tax=Albula goreensis TaxID=1534307 RepID=A0A8T3DSS6_9TELE|nr:hypothetical protein AGOR_G00087590 [Albula goreensis]